MQASELQRRWFEAMADQDQHDMGCRPCAFYRFPVCAEGKRLQLLAHQAHAEYVTERVVRSAVA